MTGRLAIFNPSGRIGLAGNPFGKDVANLELFRALALHAGLEDLTVVSHRPGTDAELAAALLEGRSTQTRLTSGALLNQGAVAQAGTLLRGQPDLYELAWLRRRSVGDRGYSLVGLGHTLAPPAVRHYMAMASVAPTHPWDALVCTSPAMQAALAEMFAEWGEHLAERTGGSPPAHPALPVIPLGVDAERFAAFADRPDVRASRRAALGVADDDILVLWVGRLSFYEKAFPQPMLQAVQAAARETGVRVAFAWAGWFPADRDAELFREAAAACAPNVDVHFLDGNDRDLVGELWAASDIFLSLVDNIQETFGITPIEAMAAGLPIVASDWDGYRFTIRNGAEGFLAPTLFPPGSGLGDSMVLHHTTEAESYQSYVGTVAQHTAVNIPRATQGLVDLIRSADLRRSMGAAGRGRVRAVFDWPVVARRYAALFEELAAIRTAAADPPARHRMNPVKSDPFRAFRGFANRALGLETPLTAAPGAAERLAQTQHLGLDQAFGRWRGDGAEHRRILELLADGEPRTVKDILLAFPAERRRAIHLSLAWMAKYGIVDWPT